VPGADHTDLAAAADALEAQLRAAGQPERAEPERRYLKIDLEVFGTAVGDVRRAVRTHRRAQPNPTREGIVALAVELWGRPVFECRLAAVELLVTEAGRLETGDLALVERLVRHAGTWALVDPLAIHVAAPVVERHHESARLVLEMWAGDDSFWVRRSALLALLPALRRGDGDFETFGRYADAMLDEREFFIRKAIGWVLRETGRRRPDLVLEWLEPRIHRASGVTVREALKPLADDARAHLLALRSGRAVVAGPQT